MIYIVFFLEGGGRDDASTNMIYIVFFLEGGGRDDASMVMLGAVDTWINTHPHFQKKKKEKPFYS